MVLQKRSSFDAPSRTRPAARKRSLINSDAPRGVLRPASRIARALHVQQSSELAHVERFRIGNAEAGFERHLQTEVDASAL